MLSEQSCGQTVRTNENKQQIYRHNYGSGGGGDDNNTTTTTTTNNNNNKRRLQYPHFEKLLNVR